ncbi:hypothetical protein ACFQMM_01710 [Saliphagus sp. GCM10025308]
MNRRTILVKAITACSVASGGCLSGPSNDSKPDQNGSTDGPVEGRVDSVFIENLSETEVRVGIVIHDENNNKEISNRYRIPEKTGIEIPEVGIEGEEYETAVQYDGDLEEYEWSVQDTCVHENESTDFSILIEENRTLVLFAEGCDEKSTGIRAGIEYFDHEEYII